jgi:hypothetical protein
MYKPIIACARRFQPRPTARAETISPGSLINFNMNLTGSERDPPKVRELNRTELLNTQIDEVGMPMVLDPDALHHLSPRRPPAPTQLHQQTYTYYSSSNIFERTL